MKRTGTLRNKPARLPAPLICISVAAAIAALLMFWGYPNQAQIVLAPGDLDPGFGNNGVAVTYCPGEDAMVQAVAVQPDGKIIAVGFVEAATTPTTLVMTRYNQNGTLDQNFGVSGMVTDEHIAGFGVTIQPDGKILVAGMSNARGPIQLFTVARFNGDGSVDSGFGIGGKALIDFGGPPISDANGVAFTALIQPDARIVVGGTITKADGKEAIALARYHSDGSLDPTFGNGGRLSADFSHPNAAARAFGLLPDNKIVVAGSVGTNPVTWSDFYQPDDPTQDFALARFNSDGSLDENFGNGGLVTTDFFGYTDGAFALEIRPNGKMVAAGAAVKTWDRDSTDFALIRYNPDGSLDTSFGGTGKVTADFNTRADLAYALLAQPDGKTIAMGSARVWNNTHHEMALVRFNQDGSLDAGFGVGGKVTTNYTSGSSAYAAAFAPDGHIIAGGYGANQSNNDGLMLACYNRGPLEGDFSILADTQSRSVTAGSPTSFSVNIEAVTNPPAAAVNLTAQVSPPHAGIVTSFEPATIGAGGTSTLTVNTTGEVPAATYTITISGISGEMFKTKIVTLTVLSAADFLLDFDSSTVAGVRGTKVKVQVHIVRTGGFSGSVTVTPPDLSAEGVITKFPEPVTTTETTVAWKFKLKGWAQVGPHVLTFAAQDVTGRTRTAQVTLMLE